MLLFVSACFTLAILPYWNKAIIPTRFISGALALTVLVFSPYLRRGLFQSPGFYAMVLYALVCALSVWGNGLSPALAGTGLAWLCMFLAFWCLGSSLEQGAATPFLLLGVSAITMLTGCLLLGREGLGLLPISAFQESGDRLVGLFQQQGNRLAVLLAVPALFFLGTGLNTGAGKARRISLLLCLILVFFLLNASTRAWVGVFFLFAGLYLLRRKISLVWLITGLVCFILLVCGMYFLGAEHLGLYFKPQALVSSFMSRIPMWKTAWLAFLDHPLLGVGPEQFREVFARYFDANLAGLPPEQIHHIPSRTTHAHNFFISTLAETGIFGCLSLTGVVVLGIISGLKTGGTARDAAYVLAASLLVGMVNPTFGREPGTVFAAAAGLASSLSMMRYSAVRAERPGSAPHS